MERGKYGEPVNEAMLLPPPEGFSARFRNREDIPEAEASDATGPAGRAQVREKEPETEGIPDSLLEMAETEQLRWHEEMRLQDRPMPFFMKSLSDADRTDMKETLRQSWQRQRDMQAAKDAVIGWIRRREELMDRRQAFCDHRMGRVFPPFVLRAMKGPPSGRDMRCALLMDNIPEEMKASVHGMTQTWSPSGPVTVIMTSGGGSEVRMREDRLETPQKTSGPAEVALIVAEAQARGWEGVKGKGTPEFLALLAAECQKAGLRFASPELRDFDPGRGMEGMEPPVRPEIVDGSMPPERIRDMVRLEDPGGRDMLPSPDRDRLAGPGGGGALPAPGM